MKRNGNIFLIVQLFVCQIFSPIVLPLPENVLCTEQSFSHPTPFSPPPLIVKSAKLRNAIPGILHHFNSPGILRAFVPQYIP